MDKRFKVIHEGEIKQFSVYDQLENRVVVRYAEKEKAEHVCSGLNDNFK